MIFLLPSHCFANCILNSYILLLLACGGFSLSDDGPITLTRYGKVRGKFLKVDVEGQSRNISAYLGVPFAETPQRFSPPQEVLSWEPDIKMATKFGPSCYHSDDETFPDFQGAEMWNAPDRKSEDCLFLNIWTPSGNGKFTEPLPVMVWIYGGSFFSGTSSLKVYDGSYLAAYGQVVIVSLNYRLGPLGFMPPLADEIPANVGLLDQNLALRWVRDNINSFGGDANSVTLFGESAGAASIGLHAISPLSRGLFHRIILQSASQTAPWATISKDTSLARAQQLGVNLGCSSDEKMIERKLLACLRKKSARDIFNASWVTKEIFDFPFVPIHGTSFIPEHPMQMSQRGLHAAVDMLAGFNSNEGFYFALYSIPGFFINTTSLLTKNQFLKGIEMSGLRTTELVRSAVAFMYDDWSYPRNPSKYRDALDEIIGHFHVTCPVIKAAKLQTSIFPSKNTFLYHFAYRISNNQWPTWMRVMHGYEIELVFGLPFIYPNEYNTEDQNVSRRMVRAWINFAKYGNPSGMDVDDISWPVYNGKSQSYVEISEAWDSVLTPTPHALQCAFWDHYLPSLELASVEIDEMRTKWAIGFNRWTTSMSAWENAKARRDNNKCSNDGTP